MLLPDQSRSITYNRNRQGLYLRNPQTCPNKPGRHLSPMIFSLSTGVSTMSSDYLVECANERDGGCNHGGKGIVMRETFRWRADLRCIRRNVAVGRHGLFTRDRVACGSKVREEQTMCKSTYPSGREMLYSLVQPRWPGFGRTISVRAASVT